MRPFSQLNLCSKHQAVPSKPSIGSAVQNRQKARVSGHIHALEAGSTPQHWWLSLLPGT